MIATVVTNRGRTSGKIRCWYGNGECSVETSDGHTEIRGILLETWLRRNGYSEETGTVHGSS